MSAERSNHFALPLLLASIRCWPDVDDVNLHEVVSRILTPAVSGGFVDYKLPKPDRDELEWLAERLDLYEVTADEQASALLTTGPFRHFVVISPNQQRGTPWNPWDAQTHRAPGGSSSGSAAATSPCL